jgi:hypothetical protein
VNGKDGLAGGTRLGMVVLSLARTGRFGLAIFGVVGSVPAGTIRLPRFGMVR